MLPPIFTLLSPEATADALASIANAFAAAQAEAALARAVELEAAGFDPLSASDIAEFELGI
jgi:hypothetical protein